ncbi:ABC transporter substrate-binding protein [Glaciihabitans arcticus]|nr:ABC transporter substrate-binding protein [Glaciihabitans arcticus]
MSRQSRLRIGAGALALLAALALSGCGSDENAAPAGKVVSITIGSQGAIENEILAQVYGQALEAEGYAVSYNEGVGNRKAYIAGLQTGIVDLVPEYSSSLLGFFDSRSGLTTVEAMETAMPAFLKPLDLRVLSPSPAQVSYAFVVRKDFAREHNLVNIGDLADVAAGITFGGAPDFPDRSYGVSGLSRIYGVNDWKFLSYKSTSDADRELIDGLLADDIQVAAIHTSAPAILDAGLVVLGDPQSMIAAQNVIPIVNKASYTKRLKAIVDGVSLGLTTQDLRGFNKLLADEDHASAEVLAHNWLKTKGYLD